MDNPETRDLAVPGGIAPPAPQQPARPAQRQSDQVAVDDSRAVTVLDGNRYIGPKVVPLRSGMECSTIYGFSSRGPYGKFGRNSEPGLTPYPLVKVYLRSQVGAPGVSLQLVVLDAAGRRVPHLEAGPNTPTGKRSGYSWRPNSPCATSDSGPWTTRWPTESRR